MTPLLAAVLRGNLDCVKILVENGADYNMIYKHGETVLTMAAQHKKFDILKYFFTNHKIDFNLRNESNETAHEIAKKHGDESMSLWVQEQDDSSKFASQLLDELSDDEVAEKKAKKKNKKSKKKTEKIMLQE